MNTKTLTDHILALCSILEALSSHPVIVTIDAIRAVIHGDGSSRLVESAPRSARKYIGETWGDLRPQPDCVRPARIDAAVAAVDLAHAVAAAASAASATTTADADVLIAAGWRRCATAEKNISRALDRGRDESPDRASEFEELRTRLKVIADQTRAVAAYPCAAAAIHAKLGGSIGSTAEIVGEKHSNHWGQHIRGKDVRGSTIQGWLEAAEANGRPLRLVWTARGVTADAT